MRWNHTTDPHWTFYVGFGATALGGAILLAALFRIRSMLAAELR
jgi:hypothetical protein